tara:strand:+ start:26 stop:754 length:729 start_codon:yes stop_codon:yes gene_type:complete
MFQTKKNLIKRLLNLEVRVIAYLISKGIEDKTLLEAFVRYYSETIKNEFNLREIPNERDIINEANLLSQKMITDDTTKNTKINAVERYTESIRNQIKKDKDEKELATEMHGIYTSDFIEEHNRMPTPKEELEIAKKSGLSKYVKWAKQIENIKEVDNLSYLSKENRIPQQAGKVSYPNYTLFKKYKKPWKKTRKANKKNKKIKLKKIKKTLKSKPKNDKSKKAEPVTIEETQTYNSIYSAIV